MDLFVRKIIKVPLYQQTYLLLAVLILVNGINCSDNYVSRASTQTGSPASRPPQPQSQPQQSYQGSASGSIQSSGNGHTVENVQQMLSHAMTERINNEFGRPPGHEKYASRKSASNSEQICDADDVECLNYNDHLGLEAIKSLHRQLDDDDNGDIDLSESDDFLREELKYDSGYEKRHKAFHFNDDMHISVKELWEAWLKSEVHNWTLEQTTDWLIQSVQLPQYVNLFKKHKITGRVLPRLAVNNMHFISNILGIKDTIHKQKIALKAMDAVLFGPPRETGTRWKDLVMVTLLLGAIIGSWYAYQQNKNAKFHLKRMAKDMESLHKAEVALQEMQSELERARMEQENVGKEKLDLERRLKEAPILRSSNSEVELQQLKQEIEILRTELSRAEVELIDHHWQPPQGLQQWLQLTYELEAKNHQKKRIAAEKQLLQAREACEKLKKKRTSFVGAFVSTHGKSIDDVDRSIVEARNSLSDVTNELQERLHRWKQIETLLGCSIVNNSGIANLENMLYRNNSSGKSSRARISSSQDDLDDDSIQGFSTDFCNNKLTREDSSASDEGDRDSNTVTFVLGGSTSSYNEYQQTPSPQTPSSQPSTALMPTTTSMQMPITSTGLGMVSNTSNALVPVTSSANVLANLRNTLLASSISQPAHMNSFDSVCTDDTRSTVSIPSDRIQTVVPPPPRTKKQLSFSPSQSVALLAIGSTNTGRTPMPPPRRTNSNQNIIFPTQSPSSKAPKMVAVESFTSISSATTFTDSGIGSAQYNNGSVGNGNGIKSNAVQQQQQFDDTGSTDSSSFDDEVKKRRRKLFSFGKKSTKTKIKNS